MSSSTQSSPERFHHDPHPSATSDPFADPHTAHDSRPTSEAEAHAEYLATHPGAFTEHPAPQARTGEKASLVDKVVGEAQRLVGVVTRDQEKAAEGEIRKAEGKAAAEGPVGMHRG